MEGSMLDDLYAYIASKGECSDTGSTLAAAWEADGTEVAVPHMQHARIYYKCEICGCIYCRRVIKGK